ncbi:hypothetical protein, partial [Aquabacterium sp.]|uniref:hypothetical protein n=1 Tax=Aquabacterium sp. TaxID=1872578 RepID=UPI0025B811E6
MNWTKGKRYGFSRIDRYIGWTNYQGKRRRSTEGAQGTNTGHENAEGMACVGGRLLDFSGHRLELGCRVQKRQVANSQCWNASVVGYRTV